MAMENQLKNKLPIVLHLDIHGQFFHGYIWLCRITSTQGVSDRSTLMAIAINASYEHPGGLG